jgi:hypothetical protein
MFEKEPEHLATCVRSTGLNQGFRPPTHAPFRVQPMSNNNHRAIRIRLCTIDDLPMLQEAMQLLRQTGVLQVTALSSR